MILHEFYIGKAFDAYNFFGAHFDGNGVVFRVFAPSAFKVSVIGEFNGWDDEWMTRKDGGGVYELYSTKAKPGMMYKYRIYPEHGEPVDKTDPYAFKMELRPNSASIIVEENKYHFNDEAWMKGRTKNYNSPMNIYEVHAGSWKKPTVSEEELEEHPEREWYTYRELAQLLIEYAKEHHYTHIEFLPLSEHPADCSWGYQVTGFFSPTSRYGSPDDLKYLINECHKAGIGVITDFVPVHFANDYYSLREFDGTALYEYPATDTGYSEWGSCNFNYFRGEICSFLQSAANYWLEEFHFDGIRMDAISNVIYWQGNSGRGVNEGGINFLREMNAGLHELHPTAMLIAEDSSAYNKVTAPVEYNGLGFDYKWDMGWMNDTLDYFKLPPWERHNHHHKLTFSMMYFYNDLFLLPFSHDEVVHGKATILQKMWGDYEGKFAQGRLLYLYMMTHPGKKLNFMGNEFGQLREWDEKREQDWDMLKYPNHDAFNRFIVDLNDLYVNSSALYEMDYNSNNFYWVQANDENHCVYVYMRSSHEQKYLIILNMTDVEWNKYQFELPMDMELKEKINSDWQIYGGETKVPQRIRKIKSKDGIVTLDIPAFSGRVFEVSAMKPKAKEATKTKSKAKKEDK